MAEISAGCKQAMYPDNVAQQDISSSAVRLVADMTFAPKSKVKAHARSAEPRSPSVKVPPTRLTCQVRSSVQDQVI